MIPYLPWSDTDLIMWDIMQINIQKSAKITPKTPISCRTHHLPFVRNGFSDSAQNFGLGTTLKPFGLGRLNKSARALGPLEDQHMEWKPAGQPEHASLKQCQLIVANRCSGHPQQVVEIRFLCNVIDAGALIGPCSHVTSCCCLIS